MKQSNSLEHEDLSRRRFIAGFSKLVGTGVAVSLLAGNAVSTALAYTPNPESANAKGKILSKSQMQILRDMCSVVIPVTDTPGAAEVDAHGFVDNQLAVCTPKEVQNRAKTFLDRIDKSALKRHQRVFTGLTKSQQFQMLTDIELAQSEFNQRDRNNFKLLKRLIAFGYYTSEIGATKELRYLPVPGGFKGSIPYKNNDRAWAY
jgi:hypothetical protein